MIGMKLILTGVALVFTASLMIKAIGKYPGPVIGAPLVVAWFGGAAMIVFGLLAAIWQ